jgi:periplasmic protein TorT
MNIQKCRFNRLTALLIAIGMFLVSQPAVPVFAADAWYPLEVDVWDPPFNTERKRGNGTYVPLKKAAKAWKICASIPHLKDPYWTAVNFGLIDQAKQMGVGLRLFEAGGYGNLETQRKQIRECMETGADAVIIGGISADGLNDVIEEYSDKGKVVIDLIYGINSPNLTARSGVDFWDMGLLTAKYLRHIEKDAQGPVKVGWFPGPDGAGWVSQGDKGFRKGLEDRKRW